MEVRETLASTGTVSRLVVDATDERSRTLQDAGARVRYIVQNGRLRPLVDR